MDVITLLTPPEVLMAATRTPIRFHHSQDDSPCRCLACQRLEDAIRRAVTVQPDVNQVAA
jgi:predicted alpha/beta hydrolase